MHSSAESSEVDLSASPRTASTAHHRRKARRRRSRQPTHCEENSTQLECRVSHTLRVPPVRTVFIAEVVATTVHEGVCDDHGRLRPDSAAFFGMAAGCGEFFTLGRKVGHIGQSVGRHDIRY